MSDLKKIFILLTVLVAALSLGVGYLFFKKKPKPTEAKSTENQNIEIDNETSYQLRLSGSNTIGEKLAPELIKAWLMDKKAKNIQIETVGLPDAHTKVVAGEIDGEAFKVLIESHGSSSAFTDLANQKTDIGMASRHINLEEKRALAALGDMESAADEYPIALDGIAVIVAPENRKKIFTKKELQAIFCGNAPMKNIMRAYVSHQDSGTYDIFEEIVCEGSKLSSHLIQIKSSTELEAKVAQDPMSIGFVGLPYVKTAKTVAVSDDDQSQPFLPTVLTVKKEDYLLSRRLYFYISEKSKNIHVTDFIKFVESEIGQKVVSSVGFINFSILNAEIANTNIPCELSPKWTLSNHNTYCKLHDHALDSGIEFHFKEGTSEIDNRGFQDTQRLITALGNHQVKSNHITLVGFADSTGDYTANIALAQQRAENVGNALRMLGFEPNILSFGAELPVRSNKNAAGREANRRVEVWLPK